MIFKIIKMNLFVLLAFHFLIACVDSLNQKSYQASVDNIRPSVKRQLCDNRQRALDCFYSSYDYTYIQFCVDLFKKKQADISVRHGLAIVSPVRGVESEGMLASKYLTPQPSSEHLLIFDRFTRCDKRVTYFYEVKECVINLHKDMMKFIVAC